MVSLPVLYYTVDDRHILDILCIVLVVLVPVFVAKDFVRGWFVAQIRAPKCARAPEFLHICATIDEATPSKSLATNIGTLSRNILTNFELKRFKPKLNIV